MQRYRYAFIVLGIAATTSVGLADIEGAVIDTRDSHSIDSNGWDKWAQSFVAPDGFPILSTWEAGLFSDDPGDYEMSLYVWDEAANHAVGAPIWTTGVAASPVGAMTFVEHTVGVTLTAGQSYAMIIDWDGPDGGGQHVAHASGEYYTGGDAGYSFGSVHSPFSGGSSYETSFRATFGPLMTTAIDTLASHDLDSNGWDLWAQSFVAPDGFTDMVSYEVGLYSDDPSSYELFLYEWNEAGDHATGGAIWTSGVLASPVGAMTFVEHEVGVGLTPGQSYAMIIDWEGSSGNDQHVAHFDGNPYAGGDGNFIDGSVYTPFHGGSGYETTFRAVFSNLDTEAPTATQGTIDAWYASASDAEAAAIAATTDLADNATPAECLTVSALAAGSCDTVVTVSVADLAGNVATFDYGVLIDGDAPVMTAPADMVVEVVDPGAPILPEDSGGYATATDACDAAPAVTYSDLLIPATESTPMQVIRTWTGTDASGNSASADQTLTVELADTDNDGLTDFDELTMYGTDPALPDTDNDGLDDGEEIEMAAGTGCPDALDADSDGDTLLDGAEIDLDIDPCNPDTDGDGLRDDVDPLPSEPGATEAFIVDQINDLCGTIWATDLDQFEGRRFRHRLMRRAIMTIWCNIAAHRMECGQAHVAQRILERKIYFRVDGEHRPRRDWMHDSAERDLIRDDATLIVDLLAYEL